MRVVFHTWANTRAILIILYLSSSPASRRGCIKNICFFIYTCYNSIIFIIFNNYWRYLECPKNTRLPVKTANSVFPVGALNLATTPAIASCFIRQ